MVKINAVLLFCSLLGCVPSAEVSEPTSLPIPVVPVSAPASEQAASLAPPASAPASAPALLQACGRYSGGMQGPAASKKEACINASFRYANCEKIKTILSAKPTTELEVIELAESPGHEKNRQFIFYIKTSEGWFARRLGTDGEVWVEEFSYDGPPTAGIQRQHFTPPMAITTFDVLPNKGLEVILEYPMAEGSELKRSIPEGHYIDVCGVSSKGSPSCSGDLFLTVRLKPPKTKLEELFTKDGEVYAWGHSGGYRDCRVDLR